VTFEVVFFDSVAFGGMSDVPLICLGRYASMPATMLTYAGTRPIVVRQPFDGGLVGAAMLVFAGL
jgi:hypothetical protein